MKVYHLRIASCNRERRRDTINFRLVQLSHHNQFLQLWKLKPIEYFDKCVEMLKFKRKN